MIAPELKANLIECLQDGLKGTVLRDGRSVNGFEHAATLITSLEILEWSLSDDVWPRHRFLDLMRESWRHRLREHPPAGLAATLRSPVVLPRPFQIRKP